MWGGGESYSREGPGGSEGAGMLCEHVNNWENWKTLSHKAKIITGNVLGAVLQDLIYAHTVTLYCHKTE